MTNFAAKSKNQKNQVVMKKISLLVLSVIAILMASCNSSKVEEPTTQFRFHDGTFRIAHVADVHYGCTEKEKLAMFKDMIAKTVADEKPDLFVLTGDLVTGGDDARQGWRDMIEVFDGTGLPWAVVLGNHDAEANEDVNGDTIFNILKSAKNIVNLDGAKVFGHGNKALPVLHADNDSVAAVVYCIDSNDYPKEGSKWYGLSYYDIIHEDQVQWYIDESNKFKAMNGGVPVPSVAYYHICLPEFKEVALDPNHHGMFGEACCPADVNTGFFDKIRYQGDMIGMFVGHDHTDDYVGIYKDICLGYGRQSGVEDENDTTAPMGVRIVELKEGKREFDTWVYTLKNGEEDKWYYPSGLSSTFEKDLMPAQNVEVGEHGVKYAYYVNNTEKVLNSVNDICKPANKVEEGTTEKIDVTKAKQEDWYGFDFDTYVNIPESGAYKMILTSDDGSVLYLDGKLLIDNDGSHGELAVTRCVGLEKGLHHLQVKYLENYSGNQVSVKITGKSMPEMEIPAEWYFLKK